MEKIIQQYAVPVGVFTLLMVITLLVAVIRKTCSWISKKREKKPLLVKIGPVLEMAKAFDRASKDKSPVITGRLQGMKQRIPTRT